MPSSQQPNIDPSEIALEGSAAERFKSPNDAFWMGIRDAAGAPAMVLFAGMVGFGAMGVRISKPERRLVPALLTGTLLLVGYGVIR